uniref:EGF-like domain-containing protein n=1 Tax=Tanacetum cinerariifolium TaxID=118510 RepID=A0A699JE47_TANCI|nr:EGF-like domain-containing protein [Tanacetum cinerariifolium]
MAGNTRQERKLPMMKLLKGQFIQLLPFLQHSWLKHEQQAIGAIRLFVGWLMEFFSCYKRGLFYAELLLNMLQRWQIKGWFPSLVKTVLKRFRWFFVLVGFVALAMAAISWSLELTESYWFWHSMWHVSIYTSSFFFLCSKVNIIDSENQGSTNTNYQLTRQDSLSRGQEQPGNEYLII